MPIFGSKTKPTEDFFVNRKDARSGGSGALREGSNDFTTFLDTDIRGIQDEGLEGIRSLLQRVQGVRSSREAGRVKEDFRSLLPRVGNVTDAALRPFRDNFENQLANTERGFSRRGLGGSSLAASAINNQRRLGERDLSDQRALLDRESLGLEGDILNSILNADSEGLRQEQSILQQEQQVIQLLQREGQNRLNEELSLLGLSPIAGLDPDGEGRDAIDTVSKIGSTFAGLGGLGGIGGLF